MKYKFEDFLTDGPVELSPDAPLQDKVAALEKQVGDLEVKFGDLKSSVANIDEFFRTHIARLADDAGKDFVQKIAHEKAKFDALEERWVAQIQQAVGEKFQSESNELAKAVFNAIVARIQPHALKQR
jgi:hypothetical protein